MINFEITQVTLPIIKSNFDAVKQNLGEQLKKFELIVQEDDVKIAKQNATTLNKLKSEIETLRKEKTKELSAPIKEFELKAKELANMCENTRQGLLTQVAKFEDKKLLFCKELLNKELQAQYKEFMVFEEFQNVEISDLVILSNLNKNSLAKKARDIIKERVLEALKHQKMVETRLLELGNYCLKNGLEVPLTKENIISFLYLENDELYKNKLNSLIKSEIIRIQNFAKKENVSIQTTQLSQTPAKKPANNINPIKCKYIVTATFEIEVDERLESRLESALINKFINAIDKERSVKTFKTIPKINIKKMPNTQKTELVVGGLF